MADWISLLPFIITVVVVAVSGAVFMPGPWYDTLDKPKWTPPDWVFGPAWSVLYLMIAVAGWLVWKADGFGLPLIAWAINLVLNGAWSWLMFGRRRIDLALYDAVGMLVTIIAFIVLAAAATETASLLFLPYLAWVSFATALNWSILRRNPQDISVSGTLIPRFCPSKRIVVLAMSFAPIEAVSVFELIRIPLFAENRPTQQHMST